MSDEPQRPTPGDGTAWGAYWTAQGMPWLPGTSASKAAKGTAMLSGALVLVGYVPLTLLAVGWSGARGGHLPWPVLQWALTTPLGALLLIALCVLVIGPPGVLFNLWQLKRQVAQAIDMTDLPPAAWPGPWPTRPRQPRIQRWLGYGRREQALSLALLVLGTLLAVALVVAFLASFILWSRGFGDVRVQCDTTGTGCPPTFPLMAIPSASLVAVVALSQVARFRWLRRAEATSRLWLRYRDWSWPSPLYYVRPSGVTPEAAAAALVRLSSVQAVPLARQVGIYALAMTPIVLLVSASFVLSAWLQLQWIPG
jgi:hypothetical protein